MRDRLDDLPVLARHFIRQLARRHDEDPREITGGGLEYLRKYHWPGNVRELKAAIERAMTLTSDRELDATSFDLEPPIPPPGYRLGNLLELEWKDARDGFAAAYAERLLKQHGGNVRRAAEAAGLATRGLYKMLQRVGLRPGQGLPSRDR